MTEGKLVVLTLFFLLFTFMTARSREVRTPVVGLIFVTGFLTAMTPMGYPIWWCIKAIGDLLL